MGRTPPQVRALVCRCLGGDQEAMRELVERYRQQVMGLCYRMLGHHQDAEDIAQETFVRALRGLHGWDPARDFEPWLLAIAGNRCRTALAARSRRPRQQPLVDQCCGKPGDQQLRASWLAEEVGQVLLRLRGEYREAFLLFHQQQLSYKQIAQAMQCPLGTAKTWVHRARCELIKQLRRREVVEEQGHAVP